MFSRLQAAMDEGHTDQLVFFAFDLLFLNGQSTAQLPLIVRKERLKRLFKKEVQGLRYSGHVTGDGPRFREHVCKLGSRRHHFQADRPAIRSNDRGLWVNRNASIARSLCRGWTGPEGSRRHIGALLLGYYTEDGRLHYAGRAGTGMERRRSQAPAGFGAASGAEDAACRAAPARRRLRVSS